jgi:hypothetical protein
MAFEIPDLASRRSSKALIFFVSSFLKSRSSAVGVSYIQRSSTRLDAQIKSHNTTKLFCIRTSLISGEHAETRLSKEGITSPKFDNQTIPRGNLAHLRRARWHCKNACTEFRSSRFPLLYEGFRSKIKSSPSYLNRPLIHEDLFSLVENFQLPACRSKTCSRSQQCSLLTTIIGLFTTMIQPFSNLSTITKYKPPTMAQ